MGKLENLQTYYVIYNHIRDIPRYNLKTIARTLGLSGRGHSYTTASNYVRNLYQRGISLHPNLILRNFENCYTRAYFLKVDDPKNLTTMFSSLKSLIDDHVLSYMLLLSGRYDFLVTSKSDLTFQPGLTIKKKSILYNPVYTHPVGWNLEMKESFRRLADSELSAGKFLREMEEFLFWGDSEFRIFDCMKTNVQKPFSQVARACHVSPNTVRKYFNEGILPCCEIAHYFFPRGYSHYQQSLIVLKSKYEKDFVRVLSKLPCTTYVFLLQEEIVLDIFHEGAVDMMFAIKKLEEKGYIDDYFLLIPLYWD
ncbi:MAG: hypothetical protein HXS52_12090 [Theionarchaea archaeon]|nr:hypothetical protein [Theionarchaea archaeon]MBU7038662.1 hypothetical protein [Theionarchaea archaeon]